MHAELPATSFRQRFVRPFQRGDLLVTLVSKVIAGITVALLFVVIALAWDASAAARSAHRVAR